MATIRENASRAKHAKTTLYIYAVVGCVVLLSEIMQHFLLVDIRNGVPVSYEKATMNDLRHAILNLLLVGSFIVSAVFFIMWFRRAYYNQEQTIGKMDTTNGWCSGAWFIPIYSFYKPYALMQELFHNANRYLKNIQVDVPEKRNSLVLGAWWIGWVTLNITQNIVNRLEGKTAEVESLINYNVVSMVLTIAFIVLVFPTVKLISNYNELELQINEDYTNTLNTPFTLNLDDDLLDS